MCTDESKKSFEDVKYVITWAPIMVSPDYSKAFQIFYFASTDIITRVLLQKNDKNEEQPIESMSKALISTKMKYHSMETHAYVLLM